LRDKVVDEEVPGDVQGAGEPELLLRSGSQDCGEEFCEIRHGERCGPGSKEAISGAPIAYPLKLRSLTLVKGGENCEEKRA